MNSEVVNRAPFGKHLVKKSLKFGAMAAVLLMVGMGIFYFIFDNKITSIRDLTVFFTLIFMFFAVKEFRSDNLNRLMFWQGTFIGLFTALTFAAFTALIVFVYIQYIDPQSLTNHIDFLLKSEVLKASYDESEIRSLDASGIATHFLFTIMYIGVFASAIIAVILRKTSEPV
jgi:hypothetical protein